MKISNLGRSGLFWYSFLCLAVYAVLFFAFPVERLIDLVNGLFFGVCIAVMLVLTPLFGRSIAEPTFDRVSQLTVGMFLVWVAVTCMRGFSVFHRATGIGGTIINNPFISFASWLAICGGLLYITAPGMVGSELKHNKFYLCLVVIVGIMFAILTFVFQTR